MNKWFRRLLVALAIALGVALALAPTGALPYPKMVQGLMNFGHLPGGLLLVWLLLQLRRLRSFYGMPAVLIATGLLYGVEVIQPSFGRNQSLEDFYVGAAGVFVAWAWYLSTLSFFETSQHRAKMLQGGAVVLFAATAFNPLADLMAIVQMYRDYPTLSPQNDRALRLVWKAVGGETLVLIPPEDKTSQGLANAAHGEGEFSQGRPANAADSVSEAPMDALPFLRIHTGARKWTGVGMTMMHRDWSGFSQLCWRVRSLQEDYAGTLKVRLSDRLSHNYKSRINYRYMVDNNWREQCVDLTVRHTPSGRQLQMEALWDVIFFMASAQAPDHFDLADIHLVPGGSQAPNAPQRR